MVMESTFGLMEVFIKEILNMGLGMVMEFGMTKRIFKFFQDLIGWTKNKDLEFINGSENRFLKVNSKKIFEMVMENCIKSLKNLLQKKILSRWQNN